MVQIEPPDVNLVFKYVKNWGPNSGLSLQILSLKLTVLLLLVFSQRAKLCLTFPQMVWR